MIPYTDITGLAGNALALAAIALRLPPLARLAPHGRLAAAAALMLIALIPLGALPLAGYLRGAIGDLSMPTMLLLANFIAGHTWRAPAGKTHLLALIAVAALLFYPLALGVGSFDPYRLGYGHYGLLAILLFVALGSAWLRAYWVAASIALAVLAWSAGCYESSNLWDYLLDPLVACYAIVSTFARLLRRPARV